VILKFRVQELDFLFSFDIISTIEATLRFDYMERAHRKRKGEISHVFRDIYKSKKDRVRLEEDILDIWGRCKPSCKSIIGKFKGVLKYRDWIAHGRYWILKVQKYNTRDVHAIACELIKRLSIFT